MSSVKAFITDVNRDGFHEVAEAILASGGKDAEHINYDNTASGLAADNVQDAIDEVAGDVGDLVTAVNGISGDVDDLETAISGISDDVDDLETAVSGKVSKSGDTMTGKLTVENDVKITGDLIAPHANIINLNYHDEVTDKNLNLTQPFSINTGGTLQLPDKSGTLATTSDIPTLSYVIITINCSANADAIGGYYGFVNKTDVPALNGLKIVSVCGYNGAGFPCPASFHPNEAYTPIRISSNKLINGISYVVCGCIPE